RYALLGFLSWKPFAGYDLKKLLSNSLSFHWSGNNNQVYGTLIQLHKEGSVSIEVMQQEKLPARKVYTITERGREELGAWLRAPAELPLARNDFATRLAWAHQLPEPELLAILDGYAASVEAHLALYREKCRRGEPSPARSPREAALWGSVQEHALGFYESELEWLRGLRLETLRQGAPLPPKSE
ncbi:PadR family transcriptional regulator, partial [bacterium]|nr:PadR family transcriptional regulator [bacterium]